MPTSNYAAFEVYELDAVTGAKTPRATATVKLRKNNDGTLLDTVATDADGVVAAGTLSVVAGTEIFTEYEDANGRRYYGFGVTT